MNATTRTSPPTTGAVPDLRLPTVLFMALAAAVGTSTIYVLQPSVSRVAHGLHAPVTAVGVALACGPVGYLLGLIALVPLVDRHPPARVLGGLFGALAAALALTSVAPGVATLALLVAATGSCSVIGAGMSSTAGRLSAPHRRATTLGVVTSGISVGILGGRLVGGLIADHLGWRAMLLWFALACAVLAACCPAVLPAAPAVRRGGYLTTIASLPRLFARHRALRLAAARGALWFFGFCAVWSGLAVALSRPPFSYSPDRIGLYALAGLSGMVATRVAGGWTDRIGARRVVLLGLALAGAAALTCALALHSTSVTLVALACFDAGLFGAQVANQSTVLAIDPAAPARFNSAYMVVYFVGGSAGTAFGAASVGWWGWPTTAGVVVGAIACAAAVTGASSRH